jgi:hypothetical protein
MYTQNSASSAQEKGELRARAVLVCSATGPLEKKHCQKYKNGMDGERQSVQQQRQKQNMSSQLSEKNCPF